MVLHVKESNVPMSQVARIAKIVLGIWIAAVITALFLVLPRYEGLGNAGRIMVLHVPTAWVSVLAFAISALFSAMYLQSRRTIHDNRALAAAECGFLFTLLATITGMIFSQAVWGIYWNWDPRQTSIFVLLLIYAALFALRSALDSAEQRRRLGAVYSLFAFVTVPFLIFIVPRLSESTLHPNCALLPGSRCNGIELQVGNIGLLGDRKVQLLSLDQQGDTVVAQVKISEPGLESEIVLAPTYNVATGSVDEVADVPGTRFQLQVQQVDDAMNQALLNVQAPGTGILNNQRTLIVFVASVAGFTGLFAWMWYVRVVLLRVQWQLAQYEGANYDR